MNYKKYFFYITIYYTGCIYSMGDLDPYNSGSEIAQTLLGVYTDNLEFPLVNIGRSVIIGGAALIGTSVLLLRLNRKQVDKGPHDTTPAKDPTTLPHDELNIPEDTGETISPLVTTEPEELDDAEEDTGAGVSSPGTLVPKSDDLRKSDLRHCFMQTATIAQLKQQSHDQLLKDSFHLLQSHAHSQRMAREIIDDLLTAVVLYRDLPSIAEKTAVSSPPLIPTTPPGPPPILQEKALSTPPRRRGRLLSDTPSVRSTASTPRGRPQHLPSVPEESLILQYLDWRAKSQSTKKQFRRSLQAQSTQWFAQQFAEQFARQTPTISQKGQHLLAAGYQRRQHGSEYNPWQDLSIKNLMQNPEIKKLFQIRIPGIPQTYTEIKRWQNIRNYIEKHFITYAPTQQTPTETKM